MAGTSLVLPPGEYVEMDARIPEHCFGIAKGAKIFVFRISLMKRSVEYVKTIDRAPRKSLPEKPRRSWWQR